MEFNKFNLFPLFVLFCLPSSCLVFLRAAQLDMWWEERKYSNRVIGWHQTAQLIAFQISEISTKAYKLSHNGDAGTS